MTLCLHWQCDTFHLPPRRMQTKSIGCVQIIPTNFSAFMTGGPDGLLQIRNSYIINPFSNFLRPLLWADPCKSSVQSRRKRIHAKIGFWTHDPPDRAATDRSVVMRKERQKWMRPYGLFSIRTSYDIINPFSNFLRPLGRSDRCKASVRSRQEGGMENHPCKNWVLNPWSLCSSGEDTRLRPHGHCDWPMVLARTHFLYSGVH